jgi:hypothetical protein
MLRDTGEGYRSPAVCGDIRVDWTVDAPAIARSLAGM